MIDIAARAPNIRFENVCVNNNNKLGIDTRVMNDTMQQNRAKTTNKKDNEKASFRWQKVHILLFLFRATSKITMANLILPHKYTQIFARIVHKPHIDKLF